MLATACRIGARLSRVGSGSGDTVSSAGNSCCLEEATPKAWRAALTFFVMRSIQRLAKLSILMDAAALANFLFT
jgi:hypothetical protein